MKNVKFTPSEKSKKEFASILDGLSINEKMALMAAAMIIKGDKYAIRICSAALADRQGTARKAKKWARP